MGLRAKVAHGLKWQAIMIGGRHLLSLVIFGILARLLDPADLGLMGMVYVYLFLGGIITDPGLGTALVQRSEVKAEHWDTAFWFNVGCALVLCFATLVMADPIAAALGDPRLAPLLRWSSASIVISAAAFVHGSQFARDIDFRRPALRTLLAQFAGGLVGIAMALRGFGVWALVGQQLFSSLIGSIFVWAVSTYRPHFRFSWYHLRTLSQVGSPVFVNALLGFLTSRLDQIIIGRFAGPAELGFYAVAGKLPEMAKMVTQQPLIEVLVPALSRLQHDHTRMRHAIHRGMELLSIIVFAVYCGIALVSAELVPLLFGEKWTQAALLCSLLSLYALVGALLVFIYPALVASGALKRSVYLSISNALGVLIASLLGIRFGIPHLIFGLIANALIQSIPLLMLLNKIIGLHPFAYCRPCLPPLCSSALMCFIVLAIDGAYLTNTPDLLRLIIKVALGSFVYISAIYFLNRDALKNIARILFQGIRGGST